MKHFCSNCGLWIEVFTKRQPCGLCGMEGEAKSEGTGRPNPPQKITKSR